MVGNRPSIFSTLSEAFVTPPSIKGRYFFVETVVIEGNTYESGDPVPDGWKVYPVDEATAARVRQKFPNLAAEDDLVQQKKRTKCAVQRANKARELAHSS